MIHPSRLLSDLKPLLRTLENGIRDDLDQPDSAANDSLRAEWQAARDAGRSAATFQSWREDEITQAAVHWILGCVFLRFVEDNGLVDRPWLSAPAPERRALARDRHEAYFRASPHDSDRDYIRTCFEDAARLPGMKGLFEPRHNPVWRIPLSGDGGMALREFWLTIDPDTGDLIHDFTDEGLETRFLGDLYQDLSEAARKRYALLQTPEFVEEFILDRTLEPAIKTFGYREATLIDPTCGSGHFLIGAFRRLMAHWQRNHPTDLPRDLAQKALSQVAGVDLNPFAVEITRFRLLVEALRTAGINRLTAAPDFTFELAAGDSLLHGKRFMQSGKGVQLELDPQEGLNHVFETEDKADLDRILGRQYHAVVGNPPYITVKDKALSQAYRDLYFTCHRQYSLGVPFTERFFDLALPRNGSEAGFVGLITANSFMKREFGKKLIEQWLPKVDLTHVINTDGAYIPGHGTPTVILFGRNRNSGRESTVRTVMGIRGEPGTPDDPARGLVWTAILDQVDRPGSEGEFVSVADLQLRNFAVHPWSLSGGEAPRLKSLLEKADKSLKGSVTSIGFFQDTHADEAFVMPVDFTERHAVGNLMRAQVRGENVRDFTFSFDERILFPYDSSLTQLNGLEPASRYFWMWQLRTLLWSRRTFDGRTYREAGRPWFDYHQFPKDRARTQLTATFAFVATHNHFVLDRGGKVFNRSAPVIKLPAGATEDDHLELLGLLNSATACFWMKQVMHNKGGQGISEGFKAEAWERFIEFTGTGLKSFPLAPNPPLDLARRLDDLARELTATLPPALLADGVPSAEDLARAEARAASIRRRMIALQEELDWRCYRLYGVVEGAEAEGLEWPADRLDDLPEIDLGQRAFEIAKARRMAAGELETTWFARHGSTPVTDLPDSLPEDYRALVGRRLALMAENRSIGLVERPEYKRRWQWTPWAEQQKAALRRWLLDRLEGDDLWGGREAAEPRLLSANQLADRVARDADFVRAAELYLGEPDPDLPPLVRALVLEEAVPFLPGQRYKAPGLRKRAQWEEVWDLQRAEDAIDARTDLPEDDPAHLSPAAAKDEKARVVGDIPVPPKYKAPDFRKPVYWRLRGGLDVPKERFVLYPNCERSGDGSPVVCWAGYDALRQAIALAGFYQSMKDEEGWEPPRLLPLLAGVAELVPWLKQWHNAYDPATGARMGDTFAGFAEEEAKALGTTLEGLREVARRG